MRLITILLVLISNLVFSQQQAQQASYWYFGGNAGIKFDTSGNVTALTNGQLNTTEGCATISDTNGNLMFYTDGIKIWNRNHVVMPNGSGLMGNASTSQSAIIVPKPGSPNLFYVFTLDYEVHPNGFRYSIVDMNLNGGLGDVTSNKNVLIYTPSDEKLAVTKHSNGVDYWIVTHGWNNNTFYSYLLTSTGLSTIPVTSNAGVVVTGNTNVVYGCMKIAPDGSKLAVARVTPYSEVMDFNSSTGVVSNPQITYNGMYAYGVEFSPNSQLVYVSVAGTPPFKVIQYDLNTPNVATSSIEVYSSNIGICALQLAPNNKIYGSEYQMQFVASINNPDTIGIGCNFQINAINLLGKTSYFGLPAFVTSFFNSTSITANNACEGETIPFTLTSNQVTGPVLWDFGDGTTSNNQNPSHQYNNPGTYTITFNGTSSSGSSITSTKTITVYAQPSLLSSLVNLKQCDDDSDGFSNFNLNESITSVVSNSSNLNITFHKTIVEAQNGNNPIQNTTAYTNQIVSNDSVYIRVENTNGCFKIAQINLIVTTTVIPSSFQLTYSQCDDTTSGSNTDGITSFDFSNATSAIQNLFPVGQLLNITFYNSITDALAETNAIINTSNYSNNYHPYNEDIYVRVESQINNECLGLGHYITLKVEPIPIIQPLTIRHCDDNQDGLYNFDTSSLQSNLLNGLTNVTLSYTDWSGNPIVMTNPFQSSSQTINVKVKNNYGNNCEYTSTIQFIVDTLPIVFPIPTNLTTACDDETIPVQQNGIYPFNTTNFQSIVLGNQTGMIVKYYDANNIPLSSPLPNPFYTPTQNIKVEVINPNNSSCIATGNISFVVNPIPNIYLTGNELICSNNPSFIKIIDAGLITPNTSSNYTYNWFFNNAIIPSAHQETLSVNTEGVYTVEVTNSSGCSSTRTITVYASSIATINNIQISDVTDNNEIQILVSGLGDYTYSLNGINFQSSNTFSALSPGIYTIFVNDEKGCGVISQQVNVLGIPKVFTPNNDGIEDLWNIKGINSIFNPNATVMIFDRYGKMLKQFNTQNTGWDGKYNNQLMPSDDYWYLIQFSDGKTVKGHFALKR